MRISFYLVTSLFLQILHVACLMPIKTNIHNKQYISKYGRYYQQYSHVLLTHKVMISSSEILDVKNSLLDSHKVMIIYKIYSLSLVSLKRKK